MQLMGDRNWWAPQPLRRLHDRFGLSEEPLPVLVPSQGKPVDAPSSGVAIRT
jgi:RND superfamily putative drug exporter